MSDLQRRVERLEAATAGGSVASYRSFLTVELYRRWLADYSGPFVKVYIGVSPDDWPGGGDGERLAGAG